MVISERTRETDRSTRHAESGSPIALLIVTATPEQGERWAAMLSTTDRFEVRSVATSTDVALEALERTAFDVALVSASLPDGDAFELVRHIAQRRGLRAVVFGAEPDRATAIAAFEAGADGYLVEEPGRSAPQLTAILASLCAGGSPVSPAIARMLAQALRERAAPPVRAAASEPRAGLARDAADQRQVRPLSSREIDVLRLVAEGLVANEVARRLYLSPHTVSTHLRNIYRKLGVSTRGETIHKAMRLGLL